MTFVALWLPFALLAGASIWDLRTREIPDAFPVLLALWTLAAYALGLAPSGWVSAVAGLAMGLGLGLAGFHFGVIGGGDTKLLIVLGGLLGMLAFPVFLLFTTVAGGILAVVAKLRGEKELPYAPAFAAGWLGLVLLR